MKTSEIRRRGYRAIYHEYEAYVDFDPSDSMICLKQLVRYELQYRYWVWEVCATYAKSVTPTKYYVVAPSKVLAREKFLRSMPWLSIVRSIAPLTREGAKIVLNNPTKFIFF